jgi:hypothetical protein
MELNREVVTFRDGTELTVMEANWAATMRLQELEEQAGETPLADIQEQIFNLAIYPKLVACSSGAIPTLQEALAMPTSELDKWYFAVKRINPTWFEALEEASRKNREEYLAKKGRKRTKSTKG